MTIEAMWYASYDASGNPPTCNRLIRLPWAQQLGAAIDLAIDLPAGRAGYRAVGRNTVTGELTWWWPDRPHAKYGAWWMLPLRTEKLMERAQQYAERAAQERPSEMLCYRDHVRAILRRLQRRAHHAARSMVGRPVPPYLPPSAKRARLHAALAILPDSHLLRAARSAQRFLIEVRYDLTREAARRRVLIRPDRGRLLVRINDGRRMPIVDAVRYWADRP